jgi:non-heme Fe2+,alpha-ketoglutarate-dependent halogenase
MTTTTTSTCIKTQFERQGFFSPVTFMSTERAGETVQRLEKLQQRTLQHFGQSHRFKLHLLEKWLFDIIADPAILGIVEQILGPDILCWSSDVFSKPAHTASFVSLHQDITYAGLTPHEHIVNIWLALTPSTSLSGCLQVVPGTHTLGQLNHKQTNDEENLLFFGQTVELGDGDAQIVDMQLQPGQASLHHMAVVHGSQPNQSDLPRTGLVLRYIRPDVVQCKAADSATLVRGKDDFNHFMHEPIPKTDWSDEAISAFELALQRPSALG